MTRTHSSIAIAALFCFFALASTEGEPTADAPTATSANTLASPPRSPAQSKSQYMDQIARELTSVRTFDGSAYRGSKDAINLEVVVFSVWAKIIADTAAHDLNPSEKAKVRELHRLVSGIQVREYPRLREAWIRLVGDAMREHDMTASAASEGSRTVRLTAGVFASRALVQQIQGSLSEQMELLRFRRVEYRRYRSADIYDWYALDVPRDGEVRQITSNGWER